MKKIERHVFFRMRIGVYYTTVYETPVQYNINNIQQEQILSNIDYGENLGECLARYDMVDLYHNISYFEITL